MSFRYRDKSNGRFASKSAWQSSHGSKGRYVREHIEEIEEEEMDVDGTELPPPEIDDLDEWLYAYDNATDFEPEEYEGGIDTGRKK